MSIYFSIPFNLSQENKVFDASMLRCCVTADKRSLASVLKRGQPCLSQPCIQSIDFNFANAPRSPARGDEI
jgi:hypothetical protein